MSSSLQLCLINQSKGLLMQFFTIKNSKTGALTLNYSYAVYRDWSLPVLLLVYKLKRKFVNAFLGIVYSF